MATRQVSVAKAVTGVHATIVGSATVTVPLTITPTVTTGSFATVTAPVYKWQVPAGTYTTLTTLVDALNASTPLTGAPPLASVLTFSTTGTKIKVTFTRESATDNTQTLVGYPMTQTHLAGVGASGGVTAVGAVRLWQTTIGYDPTPTITKPAGIFGAGTPSDLVPITIENLDATHAVWIAQGAGAPTVTKTTGERLAAGASKAYSVAGWTQVYAVATTPTVKVSVAVGRQ